MAKTPCVLVCVTGCIAAYKSAEIVRGLQKRGCRVKVLMTEHATKFVGPLTFRALTHEPVAVGLFDDPQDPIHHISLAQEPDLVLVAPATANIIAKLAHGIADDLMSTTLLATPRPIVVAPAMNAGMWRAEATQENMRTLRERGVVQVGPGSGYLACGDVDEGRLADPDEIVDAALHVLEGTRELAGKRVLITAGPTYEPIDPVRFIGNRSSGKMGIALATAARSMGAEVTLVLGPCALEVPPGVRTVHVERAREMHAAALEALPEADLVICAAAVSDYRPCTEATSKIKKDAGGLTHVELEENPDILADLCRRRTHQVVIGFAAETGEVSRYAQAKLERKGCDAIVANDVSRADSTFGSDTDKVWWVTARGSEELPVLPKRALAREILIRAQELCA